MRKSATLACKYGSCSYYGEAGRQQHCQDDGYRFPHGSIPLLLGHSLRRRLTAQNLSIANLDDIDGDVLATTGEVADLDFLHAAVD